MATAMATEVRPLTIDDLRELPDSLDHYQLIGGDLIVTPAPAPRHQRGSARLFRRLDRFVERHDLGEMLTAPLWVRLTRHDVVEPDLFFVSKDRRTIVGENEIEDIPDLVIEILSPSNRRMDLVRKMALYERSGIPEYWVADPENETLTIHQLVDGIYQPSTDGQSSVLQGLTIDIPSLFTDL